MISSEAMTRKTREGSQDGLADTVGGCGVVGESGQKWNKGTGDDRKMPIYRNL
jgi:hypothetical protein